VLALHPYRQSIVPAVFSCFLASMIASAPAVADSEPSKPTWYIVGGQADAPSGDGDRVGLGGEARHVDFGLAFSNAPGTNLIQFATGRATARDERGDGYTFLISGAYDFHTGTLVTPRILAGAGFSYFDPASARIRAATDPTVGEGLAPTMHIGFGADFDIGAHWAVSAEYRASYQGETQGEGRLGEARLDQKFTLGAKLRF